MYSPITRLHSMDDTTIQHHPTSATRIHPFLIHSLPSSAFPLELS